jgi:hypothetical protein
LAGGRSSWDAAAAAPESARGGGGAAGGATGAYKPRSSVRFDVERSPALTPAWKSSGWSREQAQQKKAGERREVERSPDLHPDRNAEVDEVLKAEMQLNERQLDRDWYSQVRSALLWVDRAG